MNADDVEILDIQEDLYDKNLFAYCDDNPICRVDEYGNLWELALAGGGMLSASSGFSIGALAGSILTGLGSITPVGWVIIGTIAVVGVVSIGVSYSKNKSKGIDKSGSEEESGSEAKSRVNHPIGRRYRYNSRKKAKEAAKRAGKGKIRGEYSKKEAHYHPDVKAEYRTTPKGVSRHDHYYYPR